jgi:hypothetical protein
VLVVFSSVSVIQQGMKQLGTLHEIRVNTAQVQIRSMSYESHSVDSVALLKIAPILPNLPCMLV